MSNHRVEESDRWDCMGEAIMENNDDDDDDDDVGVVGLNWVDLNVQCLFRCRFCGFEDENRQAVVIHIKNHHKRYF